MANSSTFSYIIIAHNVNLLHFTTRQILIVSNGRVNHRVYNINIFMFFNFDSLLGREQTNRPHDCDKDKRESK